MKSIMFLFFILIFVSCDPHSAFTECSYQYQINAIGLNDTVKTTDTIWIDNDLDAKLCLSEGVYKNGEGNEVPYFFRLQDNEFQWYEPKIIGSTNLNYVGDRYKSKYGIVFLEPGIYSLSSFGCAIANDKDGSISIHGFFKEKSNNMNLFPASVKMPDWEIGQPDRYFVYFLEVVE